MKFAEVALVATVVTVFGMQFAQLSALREQAAVTNTRLSNIERRLDESEKRDEQGRNRDEQIIAAIAGIQVSIARLETRLDGKP